VLGVALRHDGDADATVERRQELRQRSAARLSAAADPFGIDFCARQQEVDPADASHTRNRLKLAPSRIRRRPAYSCSLVPPPPIADWPARVPGYSMRSPCPNGSYAKTA